MCTVLEWFSSHISYLLIQVSLLVSLRRSDWTRAENNGYDKSESTEKMNVSHFLTSNVNLASASSIQY